MTTNPLIHLLQHVRRNEVLRERDNTTDGQLLECWLRRRDSVALEALVLRHGPMVWGICRRALPSHHDAEDAFQAAFLVFVRKAASIRSPELLASWLYGVAHQTSRKTRQVVAKRQARERQVTQLPEPNGTSQDQEFEPDLQPLLDEELARLPDKYRIVILLCDVQGKSRAEAARQLRLPEGTVASRLARSRAMLARRLARRGLTVSAATLAVMLSRQAVSASVPTLVLSNTIKVASLLAAGEGTGAVSAQVSALTQGVRTTLSLPKWKTAALALLIAGLVLAGGLVTHHLLGRPQDPTDIAKPSPPSDPPKNASSPALTIPRNRITHDGRVYSVSWSPDGKTLASAGGEWDKPGEVKLWEAATNKEQATLQGHTHWVYSVSWSPDGKILASASLDGTVKLWDVSTGKE